MNDQDLLEAAGLETREKIEALRKKLLDFSRANPLINIRLSSASTSSVIRIVDELPEIVAFELMNEGMTLQPLPAIHAERKDERTAEFRQLMVELRATNPAYLAELDRIETTLEGTLAEEATLQAEHALRALARSQLGLPPVVAAADFSLAAHARSHGVEPSYLLPEPGALKPMHEDTLLQTLLLPEKLERIGKNLEARHRAIQRETGMSVLHAVFGVLEWAHPEDQISLSPLLLQGLDVHVDKSPQGHIIELVAENIPFTNQTLVHKLADARGLDLPCIRDGQQIEDYFREIAGLAPAGWTWKVRREVVIALLPSARMAMWNDLDPAESDITLQPKVQSLLATSSGTLQSYAPDHETDHPDAARKVPCVILDADASQLSALIDAADGKDMSIEGPPGSGKSQTIVNLIAAAMHAGKTVLFVAEKLTALDVVKNRLEVAGLGDFLLTLQPGQSSAEQIYESIERRLAMRPSMHAARAFQETGTNLARRREALSRYVAAIAAPLGTTGLTVHEAIGHAIAGSETRRRMPPELRRLALPHVEAFSPSQVEEIRSSARALADRIDPSRAMAEVWVNSSAPVHAVEEAEDLCADITVMLCAAEDAVSLLKTSPWGSLACTSPLALETKTHLDLLSRISGATPAARALVPALAHPDSRQEAADHYRDIRLSTELTIWRDDTFENPASPDLASHLDMLLRILAAEREISVTKAAARVQQLRDGLAVLRGTQEVISTLSQDLRPSGTSLRDVQDATRQILACPDDALAAREVLDPENLRREADTFDRKHTELMEEVRRRASVPLDSLPDRSEIQNAADTVSSAGLLRRMGSSYKAALALGLQITPERGGRQAVAAALTALATTLNRIAALEDNPSYRAAFGPLYCGMKTDTAAARSLADLIKVATAAAAGDEDLCRALLTRPVSELRRLAEMTDVPDQTPSSVEGQISRMENVLQSAEAELATARERLSIFRSLEAIDSIVAADAVERLKTLEQVTKRLADRRLSPALSRIPWGDPAFRSTIDEAVLLVEAISAPPAADILLDSLAGTGIDPLREQLARLALLQETLRDAHGRVQDRLRLRSPFDDPSSVFTRQSAWEEASRAPGQLRERASSLRAEDELRQAGFGLLVDWILRDRPVDALSDLPALTHAIISHNMAQHARKLHSELLDQTGRDLDRTRRELADYDRQMLAHSRAEVRNRLIKTASPPQGISTGLKKDLTETALILHELGKKRRIGVRDLTQRAGRALRALKPCWMMSPLAVAQYLPKRTIFDLVVIDEASQMPPENALGAIRRARQVVVVGDAKQLPPSTFFQKTGAATNDDDEAYDVSSESILDRANVVYRPIRQLRWHYRSRHSALIQFSNHWMYDNQLTIFPSAQENDPDMGVHLRKVEGLYRSSNERGGVNLDEARAVIDAAIDHMIRTPQHSLGICTMNSRQAELIREELDRAVDRNPAARRFVEHWEQKDDAVETLFVKNLETIQGDERDVMLISTVYGPTTPGGRVAQRFGPINSAQGHRRLNVLFTRAKRKIVTFTSMHPADILVSDTSSKGVRMFRAWLEYSASGFVPDAAGHGAEVESPFEKYVAAQIEALGYEVIPQVGTAGYRVDLGVRHPDWPHGYLLGVECDGATYHSSKSSRERDRLRQEILESLGWTMHRIWSTDWFADPDAEKERLRVVLETERVRRHAEAAALAARTPAPVELADEGNADGVPGLADPVSTNAAAGPRVRSLARRQSADLARRAVLGEQLAPAESTRVTLPTGKVVKPGATVTITFDDQTDHAQTIKVSNRENAPKKGIITPSSPLGKALIDLEEGDEFKYRVGARFRTGVVKKISSG